MSRFPSGSTSRYHGPRRCRESQVLLYPWLRAGQRLPLGADRRPSESHLVPTHGTLDPVRAWGLSSFSRSVDIDESESLL